MLRDRLARFTDPARRWVARYQRLGAATAGGNRLYWCEGLGRAVGPAVGLRWRGRSIFAQNFGDALSPFIVSLLTGQPVTYASGPGKLVALGSVFFAIRDHDVVWGAGIRCADDVVYAARARDVTYTAVRGPRTWTALARRGIACPAVFGDPAQLLPLYVTNDVEPEIELGIVPHWTHFAVVADACRGTAARVIDVMNPLEVVARQILACRTILTTSLHGLIFAEAYGIPAMFVSIDGTRPVDFTKFADYFEASGRELVVREVGHPRRLAALVDRFGTVPPPRFASESLLRAFPGASKVNAVPSIGWSHVSGTTPRGGGQVADGFVRPPLVSVR